MWWLPVALAAEPAQLDADRIVWEDGVARAEGGVRVEAGDDVVIGERATWSDGRVVVQNGSWTRGDAGTLVFERAEIELDTRIGEVDGARLESGSLRLTGDRASWTPEETIRGTDVEFTPCACDGPAPWSVSSQRVEVKPGQWAKFGPGWIRVFDVPVVPTPGGKVPLTRRSGLLAPRGGWGQDGLVVAQPLYVTLGRSADTTLEPEVRTDRSVRGLAELRYALNGGTGEVHAAGGYDFALDEPAPRAAVRWSHRWTDQAWWTATDGQLTSDDTYDRDYRDRFLDRALPFREVRGLIGRGAVELTADAFQDDLTYRQELAALRIRPPTVDHRGLVATADLRARGIRGDSTSPSVGHLAAHATAERPVWAGPVRITPRLEGYGRSVTSAPHGARWGWGAGAVDLRLPIWKAGDAFQTLEPGVEVGGVAGNDVPWDRALDTAPPEGPVWAAPGLVYRHVGPWLFEARADLPITPDRVTPRLDLRWGHRTATGRVQIDRDLAHVATGVAPGPIRLDASWTRLSDEVDQVRGMASWQLGTVRVGMGGLVDLLDTTRMARTVTLGWRHPTGCLAVAANARLDTDRALPDIGVALDIKPIP